MSVHYVHSKKGYEFKITFLGRRVKSIAAKYVEGTMAHKQYQHCVPRSWVTNGYVEEVKESEE